ncbi:serine/threonine-protein kinase [Cryptosporangium aurantiacum]|uniref:non-specific serine/threonine protein kinase n=1 Tax=Cryptosporangium aurantiacum TaxID=134849 RepID=A0A1M7TXA8_9ACTN|nr:serine/threonine-protein kinase [Cryptosporangium aurantiacum]SHN75337.1 Serine/threonine protein kinase [Cryptosporangium aurantiacum]
MPFDRGKIAAALPSYALGKQVGSGGFGLVLEGRHRQLGRPVAIKVLSMHDAAVERRFLAEAQVMAAFDHPHVVHVHDYADDEGLCVLVMEHCPGGTLTDRLEAGLPPEAACAIALSIADALHAAHTRGIVHRDVKPDNVLFAADGAAKVTDFGLAKIFEGSVVTSGSLVGTPGYAAPEQILGQQVRPATDVYALAGISYHMLTGRPPYPVDLPVPEMLHHQIYRGPELPAGMPDRFATVVGHALRREPSERPESAKEFALLLAAAAAAELGPDWLSRANTPLRVEEDVLRAASGSRGLTTTGGRRLVSRSLRRSRTTGTSATSGGRRRGRHAAPDDEPAPFPSGPAEPLSSEEVRRRIAAWSHDDEGLSGRTWVILALVLALVAALSVVAGVVLGQAQRGA